jgi:hypothetical protein
MKTKQRKARQRRKTENMLMLIWFNELLKDKNPAGFRWIKKG